ncbi:MAG: ribosome maturation factor RimP [Rhodospirillales bacterium]|jgi:ribosome maturation factor RimP
MASLAERVESRITPTIESMGYDIVRVEITGKEPLVLQIMVERQDEKQLDVEDCASVSRAISALMDVDDPIDDAYTLEVSSPGLDRPLVRPQDFDRFAGYEAKVEAERLIDGRKNFKGRLIGLEENVVKISVDDTVMEVPIVDIKRAKLLLTDELIARAEGH